MIATSADLEARCVDTIRFLAADAVERARSGHPGAPMGAADLAFVLWDRALRFDPDDAAWVNRDRFVLSAGHASMLLYALLHLFEFDLPLEELRRFRQWGSRTPGHPEAGVTPGVEVTTGPLGQGLANSVGMALAQRMLHARVPEAADLLDHRVYALVSDGDLMEGVASEAASLAGHLGLGRLIALYDDNGISIEGSTALAFTEDVGARFGAYGWAVRRIDGHDRDAIAGALVEAAADPERPTLIIARTTIARGAPTRAGTAKAHGEPLGGEELRRAKTGADWSFEPDFHVPEEVRDHFRARAAEKRAERRAWNAAVERFRFAHPEAALRWEALRRQEVPGDLAARLLEAVPAEPLATRAHSGRALQAAAAVVPGLIGGSADLGPSTLTSIEGGGSVAPEPLEPGAPIQFAGRTLHFGVREHAMGAVASGIARYGCFIPYCGTFLIFSDYMRPAIRLAALMGARVIYLFTHDSVFLGEDGPTHQPIEQLASLRLVPNLDVWRPADGPETAGAWASAIARDAGPSAIVLTRQRVGPVKRTVAVDAAGIGRGGYVLDEPDGGPADLTLVATGSEVALAQSAGALLGSAHGIRTRTVSVPCLERFLSQPSEYRDSVLPPGGRFAVVEAGRTEAWCAVLGRGALRLGLDRFGASAPAETLARELGFTADSIARRVVEWLSVVPDTEPGV